MEEGLEDEVRNKGSFRAVIPFISSYLRENLSPGNTNWSPMIRIRLIVI
jgi:hypothetical protein